MGSWFSSPSAAAPPPAPRVDWLAACHQLLKNPQPADDVFSPRARQRFDADAICNLANCALKRYNSSHPGAAEFDCITEPSEQLRVACVGFRGDLWYHLNFLARRRKDGGDVDDAARLFFAELRFEASTDMMIVEACVVLEEPWCRFRTTRCAFCPDESKILHPAAGQFECGKQQQGHENEFFRHRRGTDGRTKVFFTQTEMLHTPFMSGAPVPRYSLDYI